MEFQDLFAIFGDRTVGEVIPEGTSRVMYSNGQVTEIWHNEGAHIRRERLHHTFAAVMEANKEAAKDYSRSGGIKNNTHVAAIPATVYAELQASGITDDASDFKKWLNDSDNAWVRTNNLKV